MTDDDLWLPTPTVMDATRHTVRGCWRPGENWRGVALVNAILDAGEIRIMGTHTTGMSENELPGTPNCMDAIAPRDGAALERVLRRGDRDGSRRDSTGNLREDVMMDDVDMMPTPRASDVKGRNQRNDQTCMTGAVEQGTRAIPAPGPYHGGLWGLDDGRGVRFGRSAAGSGCPAVPPPAPRRRPAACAAGSGRTPLTPRCSNRTGSPATPRSTRIRKPGWTSRCATACSRSGVKPTGG